MQDLHFKLLMHIEYTSFHVMHELVYVFGQYYACTETVGMVEGWY